MYQREVEAASLPLMSTQPNSVLHHPIKDSKQS